MARDTARAAAQSWPDANPQFIRPPLTRSRPALADTSNRADLFDNVSKAQTKASRGQLPEQFAMAALLDRS